ncbi:MAG: ubiquinol oxidase subunit II [Proteobacteria bacterium]|nr:ubiquinol oxidase subunit II [Pseudomonadota bacterium]
MADTIVLKAACASDGESLHLQGVAGRGGATRILGRRRGGRRRLADALGLCAALALSGCGRDQLPVIAARGPIALAERNLLFTAAAVMLIVVIPVFVMAFWFTWRYRASHPKAPYKPHWSYDWRIDMIVWLVPAAIVIALGYLVWTKTHRLDPYRPLVASRLPLRVDVVAEDWKWLFIYPGQKIAVANELVFPADRPLSLRLTSDTVMNSFYIPGLGGQIYAMAGMQTRLHLRADGPGSFVGRNTQYSGIGFPDQYFAVHAVSAASFRAWVARVKHAPKTLDAAAYAALAKPSTRFPVTYYSAYEPGLFDRILHKYTARMRAPVPPPAPHPGGN